MRELFRFKLMIMFYPKMDQLEFFNKFNPTNKKPCHHVINHLLWEHIFQLMKVIMSSCKYGWTSLVQSCERNKQETLSSCYQSSPVRTHLSIDAGNHIFMGTWIDVIDWILWLTNNKPCQHDIKCLLWKYIFWVDVGI